MSLISRYLLNGDVKDLVGNRHGSESGIEWVDDLRGKVAKMNAGVMSFPTPITMCYSIAFWVRLKSPTSGSYRQFMYKGEDRSPGFWFSSNADRLHMRQRLYPDDNAGVDSSNAPLTIDQWHHVVFIVEPTIAGGTNITQYLDGTFRSGPKYDTLPKLTGDHLNFLSEDYDLSDLQVYDHALSAAESMYLSFGKLLEYDFNRGTLLRDNGAWGKDGLSGSTLPALVDGSGLEPGYARFSGGQTIQTSFGKDSPITKKTTLSIVIDTRVTDTTPEAMLFSFAPVGDNRRFYVGVHAGQWSIGFQGNGWSSSPSRVDVVANEWVQVSVVVGAGVVSLYVDGVLSRLIVVSDHIVQDNMRLGTQYGGTYRYKGDVAKVSVFSKALSLDDLFRLRTNRLSIGSSATLIADRLRESPQLIWRNFGGPLHSQFGTNVSDATLRSTHPSSEVVPYAKSGVMASEINRPLYDYYVDLDDVVWYKYITTYDENGNVVREEVPHPNGPYPSTTVVTLHMPKGVCMRDVLEAADGDVLNGQVSMYIGDEYRGRTNVVNKYTPITIGFANGRNNEYGQSEDNIMFGWDARHVISYNLTSSGKDAVRCQFRCWAGNEDRVTEAVWGCRPR